MVAGLLYVIGLVSVLVTIVVAGFSVPATVADIGRQVDAGTPNYLEIARSVAIAYGGYAMPFLSGLLVMGAGRVIMLLSAINRSLRGQN
jgi:hypothetical protein